MPNGRREQRGAALPGLRAARLAKAWTQLELADKAGISRSTIGYLEAAERQALPPTVRKLAAALGLAPAALYRSAEEARNG